MDVSTMSLFSMVKTELKTNKTKIIESVYFNGWTWNKLHSSP